MNPWEKYAEQGGPWEKYAPAQEGPPPMPLPQVAQTMYTAGLKSLPGYFGNALTAAGKFPVDMWTGAQQRANEAAAQVPGEFFAPLRETAGRRAQEIEAQTTADRDINQALLNRPGGTLGYFAGMVPSIAATSMIPGANTLPGAGVLGTVLGGLQPTGEGESAGRNALTSGVLSMLGQGGANLLAKLGRSWGQSAQQQAASQASQNAVRDQVAQAARQEGLALPAAVTNPGSRVAGVVEGIAGKNTTAARMASLNQQQIDRMAREVLGAPADAPLTESLIQQTIQREYAKGYAPIKGAGQINADPEFAMARQAIEKPYREMQASFPSSSDMPGALQNLLDDLALPKWDAKSIVEKVRSLRFDAKSNFKALGDPDRIRLAQAQRQAATELENLIERNLQRQGKTGLVDQFRASRQKMAQAFDLDEALLPSGNVNAEVLGKKALAGEPLTGKLKTIGDAWALHRKGSMAINPMSLGQSQPLVTPLDWAAMTSAMGTGALGTALSSNPAVMLPALLPLARPALRALTTTRPYQSAIGTPSYGPGLLPRSAQTLLDNEVVPALLKGAGLFGALTSE